MNPMRRTGLAAVVAKAESAGTIASSSGNAIVTPMPRRKVLLGSDFLLMIMTLSLLLYLKVKSSSSAPGLYRFSSKCRLHRFSAVTFGAGDGATARLV